MLRTGRLWQHFGYFGDTISFWGSLGMFRVSHSPRSTAVALPNKLVPTRTGKARGTAVALGSMQTRSSRLLYGIVLGAIALVLSALRLTRR